MVVKLPQQQLIEALVTKNNPGGRRPAIPGNPIRALPVKPVNRPVLVPGESVYELAVRLGLYSGLEAGFIDWLRSGVDLVELISAANNNMLSLGSDGKLYVGPPQVASAEW